MDSSITSTGGMDASLGVGSKQNKYEEAIIRTLMNAKRSKAMTDSAAAATEKGAGITADASKFASMLGGINSIIKGAGSVIQGTDAYQDWAGNHPWYQGNQTSSASDVIGAAQDAGRSFSDMNTIMNNPNGLETIIGADPVVVNDVISATVKDSLDDYSDPLYGSNSVILRGKTPWAV